MALLGHPMRRCLSFCVCFLFSVFVLFLILQWKRSSLKNVDPLQPLCLEIVFVHVFTLSIICCMTCLYMLHFVCSVFLSYSFSPPSIIHLRSHRMHRQLLLSLDPVQVLGTLLRTLHHHWHAIVILGTFYLQPHRCIHWTDLHLYRMCCQNCHPWLSSVANVSRTCQIPV